MTKARRGYASHNAAITPGSCFSPSSKTFSLRLNPVSVIALFALPHTIPASLLNLRHEKALPLAVEIRAVKARLISWVAPTESQFLLCRGRMGMHACLRSTLGALRVPRKHARKSVPQKVACNTLFRDAIANSCCQNPSHLKKRWVRLSQICGSGYCIMSRRGEVCKNLPGI